MGSYGYGMDYIHIKRTVNTMDAKNETLATKRHYVDNKKFLQDLTVHLKQYKKAKRLGEPLPKCPDCIGKCFVDIANGLAKLPSYNGYSFKTEMVGDAVENMIMYYHNFNPKLYNNPFGYFSKIARWAFHRRIKKEAKAQYIKYKYAANSGLLDDENLTDSDGNVINNRGVFDNISEFIKDYEFKLEREKLEKKKKESLKKAELKRKRKQDVTGKTRSARTNSRPSTKSSGQKRASTSKASLSRKNNGYPEGASAGN